MAETLEQKRERILKEIAEAQQKIKEIDREQLAMGPVQRTADDLHSLLCTSNHTDGCGWFYESWQNPGYSRNDYVKRANRVLKLVSADEVTAVVRAIKGF